MMVHTRMQPMPSTLILTELLPAAGMNRLATRPDASIRILPVPTSAALAEALPAADGVILVMEQPALRAELIERCPRLRVASRMGAGYDNCDVEALTRMGVPLATTGGANADTVAEHALYLMLALAKRGPTMDRAVKRGDWPRGFGGVELRDRTCLVVGYGRIGKEIARRAAAFALRILIVDPNVPADEVARDGYTHAGALEGALADADFIVLACALTQATRRLINPASLARTKSTAFLLNVARGAVVDEAALADALRDGRLAGAGLDVLEIEPPMRENPLLERDDVVLTPHNGAYVRTAYERMALACVENALAGLDGRLDPSVLVNAEVLNRH